MALVLELDPKTEEKVRVAAARRGIGPPGVHQRAGGTNGGADSSNGAPKKRLTGEELLNSPLVGLWKDRPETGDGPHFSRANSETAPRAAAEPERHAHARCRCGNRRPQ